MVLTIRAPFKDAEYVKEFLLKNRLMDHEHLLARDKENIFFPILDPDVVSKKFPKLKQVNKRLERKQKKSFPERLAEILDEAELRIMPRAFDIIGNIAIFDLPEELRKKEKIIAKELIGSNKNIKTVLKKADIHSGQFRTQKLDYVAGKKTKETIHKENNILLKLDVERVYFSQRSSNERLRISRLVKPGEDVLVMFSGCGPFVFAIAKNTDARHITGIELNPVAHGYAEINKGLNKADNVTLLNGDVSIEVPKLNKLFDRIIMPLPKTAEEFLPIALDSIKKGGMIHLYKFLSESEYDSAKKSILRLCKENKRNCRITGVVECGDFAPGVHRVCVDIIVDKIAV